MSAHGPREEFVEQAWQELAIQLNLNSKHLSWFKQWFEGKMLSACGKMVGEEKDKHLRTQEWLDKFQGALSEAALEFAKMADALGACTSKLNVLQRQAHDPGD